MNSCISCGMPLEANTTSKHQPDVCIYCQDQETGELKSYDEVRTGSINAAVKFMGKSEAEATQMADDILPKLSRWQGEKNLS